MIRIRKSKQKGRKIKTFVKSCGIVALGREIKPKKKKK